MSTLLEDYRRCFEACGVALPEPHAWDKGYGDRLAVSWSTPKGHAFMLSDDTALCVCRVAAEDWLLARSPNTPIYMRLDSSERAASYGNCVVSIASPSNTKFGHDIHAALIALVYAVANVEPSK